MQHTHISRRRFAGLAGTSVFAPFAGAGAEPLTAEAVIGRIQAQLSGDWPAAGPDGLKAGDPTTVIRGIATTAMASLDVLKEAKKANANLILTYEPTFYGRADGRAPAASAAGRGPIGVTANDPIVKAKREFIEKNGLVVCRLRDHWQSRKENEMVTALAGALGWSGGRVKSDDALYDIPAASAEETVNLIRRRLNIRGGLRAVGDRRATVRRVLAASGRNDSRNDVAALFRSRLDRRRGSSGMGEHILCR